MHSTTILAMASMVVCALASPVPAGKPASLGKREGNFQPARSITSAPVKNARHAKRQTGETVDISVDEVWTINDYTDGIGNGVDQYTMYTGDGSYAAGWPKRSHWVTFDDMFNNNKAYMTEACSQWGYPEDSGPEIGSIWNAIESVAAETGVDHRFILAVILQESGGCVRVNTTGGVSWPNPGLMQSAGGSHTCNNNNVMTNPCPQSTITGMVTDGVAGTTSGWGLADCINDSNWWTDADFYRGARIYNSGSVASNNRLEFGVATHCYSSDIANRLTGWVWAEKTCLCDINPASCGIPPA